jgi:Uncharacterized protein conserved in bacteria
MVVYDLICSQGHRFEGWFADLEDLEEQLASSLLVCPVCGDLAISRRPSTFGLVKSGRVEPENPAPVPAQGGVPVKELMRQWEELSRRLETEYDNVGSNFADEALKMHYGVIERRNIRGMSTDSQENLLRKEGVEFHKVPMLTRKNRSSTN